MAEDTQKQKPSIARFLKWIGILILLILVGLVIVAGVFEKQIGALVIKALNKQLKTELKVEEATLSLIRQFPKAAVYLHQVELKGVGEQEQELLKVESISLKCGIIGLLTGSYDFKSIAINNGEVFIYSDRKGNTNYDVLIDSDAKPEPSTTKSSNLNLSISNFTISNVLVHYVDKAAKHDVKIMAKSAHFDGNFMVDNQQNMDKYAMSSYAELYSNHIKIGETNYLVNKELAYDGSIILDNAQGFYTFDQIELYLQGNDFKVDGTIEQKDEGTAYNLVFDTDNARLHSLLKLLPSQYVATLGGLESHAKMNFDGSVKGVYNKKTNPIIKLNFGLKEGRINHPKLVGSMRNVKFDVTFTNGNGTDEKTAKLELKGFEAFLNEEPINMEYTMIGLDNPTINFSVAGKIPLGAVYHFFGEDASSGTGIIDIERFNLNGKLNDMTSMYRIPKVKLSGSINIENASITSNEIETTLQKGKLTLKDNILNLADLLVIMPNNHILMNGNFQNLLPVLLSDSLNSQDAKLLFKASLLSDKMDIDELIAFSSGNTVEEIEEAPVEQQDSLIKENQAEREHLTSFLKGSFHTNITELKYGKVAARNFRGEIHFDNSIMDMKEVKVDIMNGKMELNSKIHFEQEPYVEAFFSCDNIDLQELLRQVDNLGQDMLTTDNLYGQLNSLVKINLFFDSLGNMKYDELFVLADVKITKGELINFKMLESLASVIKMQDLKNIRFTELRNQFKIEKQKIHIPAMFIQSNAFNLVIGGEYGFNHDMDFKVKINVGQILANKFKKYNPGKEPIKARKKGLFNIYAHLYGNLYDDYQYKLGPKNTKNALEAQLNSKLPTINNTLKTAFAKSEATANKKAKMENLKEPDAWEDIPEYEEGDVEEVEYIEW